MCVCVCRVLGSQLDSEGFGGIWNVGKGQSKINSILPSSLVNVSEFSDVVVIISADDVRKQFETLLSQAILNIYSTSCITLYYLDRTFILALVDINLSAGSSSPPVLVVLSYLPPGTEATKPVSLVGKGDW